MLIPLLPLTIVALLASMGTAHAKGPPDMISITGPGLKGTVRVHDRSLLDGLGFGGLENFDWHSRSGITAPDVGHGYTLVRYFRDESGAYRVFDRVRYHPNTGRRRGYVFYDGIPGPSRATGSEFDDRWYFATESGDRSMHKLLAGLGVTVKPMPPKPRPQAAGSPGPFLGLGGIALLAGAAVVLYRRRVAKALSGRSGRA
jgi:LPXTG-motif cell wall-anchored protein